MDLPPPNYAQTIEAIAQCGIPRANINIKYEDYLRSDEVTVSDLGTVTDAKMRCLKSAVHPFYILTIQNEKQRAKFYEFSRLADRPEELVRAQEWIRANGLQGRVPNFIADQGLVAFAGALEDACGLKRNSALMARGASLLAIRPGFFVGKDFEKGSNSLACLMNVFSASNATENGIRLVFIGNEAYAEEDKKN